MNADTAHSARRQHGFVLLVLTTIALASFAVVRFGHIFSIDEWAHALAVDAGRVAFFGNRPLSLLWLRLSYPLISLHPLPGMIFYHILRIASAFTLYLLICELVPRRAYFAFLAGASYLLIFVRDPTFITHWFWTGEALSFIPLILFALYGYFRYMSRGEIVFLLLGIVSAVLAILMRELVVPVLFAFPLLAFILRRDFTRARWIGLVVWYLACGLTTLNYALPMLGLTGDTYGSGLLNTDYLSLSYIAYWSWVQFWKVFSHIIFMQPALTLAPEIYPQVLLTVVITVSGALVLLPRLRPAALPDAEQVHPLAETRQAAFWVVIGALATWLGLLPFLVTWYGQFLLRVHVLAMVGEAILVAAVIWLISSLFRHKAVCRGTSIALLAFLSWFSGFNVAKLQAASNTWDQQAYFYRELAHLVPAAEENTLLFYNFDFDDVLPPFYGGFTFQAGVRYLYADAVYAASDGNMYGHDLEVSDQGIDIVFNPTTSTGDLTRISAHRWDEIIFVSVDEYGHAFILDELPPDYTNPERQAQYDPYNRIVVDAYIPPRITQLLPPLQNPLRPVR